MGKANNPFGPKGWTPERLKSLKDKTYVITGANAGTGFEAAKIFVSKGARVVMLNRNPDKSAKAIEAIKTKFGSEANVSFIKMDLAVLDSVREAAEEALEKLHPPNRLKRALILKSCVQLKTI